MNKKAQGLPINFIVIAALAILILILAAGFVIAGGTSAGAAIAPQQARNTCQGWCQQQQQAATTTTFDSGFGNCSTFCTAEQNIQGQDGMNCPELGVQCSVTFSDGSTTLIDCAEPANCP